MLSRKQSFNQEECLRTLKALEARLDDKEYIRRFQNVMTFTLNRIHSFMKGKKGAVAWSGGKDSVVLSHLAQEAGIKRAFWVRNNLEYPAFIEWAKKNAPEEMSIINTQQDILWLAEHQEMIFPQNGRIAAKWFKIVQHTGQAFYFKKFRPDILLLGRRLADGNYCGEGGSYKDRAGVVRYNPLYRWSHEDIFFYMVYYKLPFAPIYFEKNGFRVGTGPWPARQWTGSLENGWREVYDIDPEVVKIAASHIKSAEEFLNEV